MEPRANARSMSATRKGRSRFPLRVPAPSRLGLWGLAINTCPKNRFSNPGCGAGVRFVKAEEKGANSQLVFHCFENAGDVPEFYAGVRRHVRVLADLVQCRDGV